ncbi:30S ribosomal protein S1 [Weissella koreensis]|uniref:30S ribosomal protein S1 n=1 Tax=Weissella koreensis TaxID=165096 RepID=A0A7H1MNA9_9LACO|nr:30S ribosomal protein S1 [Weissella koreensis]AEJ24131.1 SSU ribosomal protein S1P [Weissella koreensis KACC 15510]AVH75743.1 30S ribosomal protein S1 [Weissella koreensis]EJF34733.1 ribosomal protein S1 [Weissella koreensis KCTC 3621]MCZ9311457.1 30S ribosomal protein S1 [Weissella koreensis]QGN20964.1 30S ribosomal protein S1 [Weissella koreensis]
MNEENNELLAALDAQPDVKVGDVVTGEVLTIDDAHQVVVGIDGAGVEGVIPARELTSDRDADVNDLVKVGDKIEAVVKMPITSEKEGYSWILSKRQLEARRAWEEIASKYNEDDIVEAPVTQVVKGGLVVDVAGVRGFIPASMIENRFVQDLNQYKGQTVKAQIIEINVAESRLILSRKAVLSAERSEALKRVFEELTVGDIVEGKVARMTNFGAFIDLGGVDGLVHVSEISYERVSQPSDVLSVGEDVKVKVLGLDPEKERISLSIKATQPGPWDSAAQNAPEGTVLEGTVRRVVDFGAFVEVFPGVEGLVHVSQISHQHVENPSDVLKAGDKVQVKVLDVNPERQRLSLSIKALTEAPAREGGDNNDGEQRRSNNNNNSNSSNNNSRRSNNNGGGRRNNSRRESAPMNYSTTEEEGNATLGDLFNLKDFD